MKTRKVAKKRFKSIKIIKEYKLDIIEERKNSYVKKDQVIAKLENKVLASQVSLATATRDLAKSNVDRLTKLLQLDSASKHLLDEAEEKLLKAQTDLNKKIIELDETIIKAPFDGKLGTFHVTEGAMVKKDDLLVVAYDASSYIIEIYISPKVLKQLSVGQAVMIEDRIEGKISDIEETLCKDNQMGLIYVKIEQCKNCLIGQSIDVKIATVTKKSVLGIPHSAIFYYDGLEVVYKIEDNKSIRTTITTELVGGNFTEIKSGLKENAALNYQVKENRQPKIVWDLKSKSSKRGQRWYAARRLQ